MDFCEDNTSVIFLKLICSFFLRILEQNRKGWTGSWDSGPPADSVQHLWCLQSLGYALKIFAHKAKCFPFSVSLCFSALLSCSLPHSPLSQQVKGLCRQPSGNYWALCNEAKLEVTAVDKHKPRGAQPNFSPFLIMEAAGCQCCWRQISNLWTGSKDFLIVFISSCLCGQPLKQSLHSSHQGERKRQFDVRFDLACRRSRWSLGHDTRSLPFGTYVWFQPTFYLSPFKVSEAFLERPFGATAVFCASVCLTWEQYQRAHLSLFGV